MDGNYTKISYPLYLLEKNCFVSELWFNPTELATPSERNPFWASALIYNWQASFWSLSEICTMNWIKYWGLKQRTTRFLRCTAVLNYRAWQEWIQSVLFNRTEDEGNVRANEKMYYVPTSCWNEWKFHFSHYYFVLFICIYKCSLFHYPVFQIII